MGAQWHGTQVLHGADWDYKRAYHARHMGTCSEATMGDNLEAKHKQVVTTHKLKRTFFPKCHSYPNLPWMEVDRRTAAKSRASQQPHYFGDGAKPLVGLTKRCDPQFVFFPSSAIQGYFTTKSGGYLNP